MIRAYQDRDLDELLGVWHRASLGAHPFLSEAFLSREREMIAEVYLPVAETWVYVKEGRVVGFISLIGHEVGAIFVDPALQGLGIGRALMDHASGLRETLDVDVFEENSVGRRFYERYGFEQVGAHLHAETGHMLLRLRLRRS